MRKRLAFALYYSFWPALIGWNPTNLCNRLMASEIHGVRYDSFGGARWHNAYNPITDDPNWSDVNTPETESVSSQG